MKYENIYVFDYGAVRFSDMTREQLLVALTETAESLHRERKQHDLDLYLLAPRRQT